MEESSKSFTPKDNNVIAILIFITNFISLIATIIVEWAYCKYEQLRVTEFKYILFICIADQAWAVIMVIDVILYAASVDLSGNPAYSMYCQVQSFLKVYFGLVEFYWTAIVCFSLQQNVFYEIKPAKYFKFWLIIVFTFPIYFALIPIMNKTYYFVEPLDTVNCFIDVDKTNHQKIVNDYTLFGCFYLQLWIVFAFNIYCVISVVRRVKSEQEYPLRLREQINGLFWYPAILFICWCWVSANRILNVFGKTNSNFLDYCDYTFIGLSGLLNSAFYAYNSIRTRTPMLKKLSQFLGRQSYSEYTSTYMLENELAE